VSAMLKAYDASTLPTRPGLLRRAWVRFRGGVAHGVETSEPAKSPPPIVSDAEGVG